MWTGCFVRGEDDWQEDPYNFRKNVREPGHPAHAISKHVLAAVAAADVAALRATSGLRGFRSFFKGWNHRVDGYVTGCMAPMQYRLYEEYGEREGAWKAKGFPRIAPGDTILHLAASCASGVRVDVCRCLCELGANPAAVNRAGETMLSLAGNELSGADHAALEALVKEFGKSGVEGGSASEDGDGGGQECEWEE